MQYTDVTVQYSDRRGTIYRVNGTYQSDMQNSTSTDAIDEGDSGGSVYILDGSTYKLHGNVSGCQIPDSGVIHTMYSSPIFYANLAGFTPRTN